MKLEFDIEKRHIYWCVTVYTLENIFDDDLTYREPLNEPQYVRMAEWCANTFQTDQNKLRARRMSYDSFWFTSKRDMDWFILSWSGVDSGAV